MDVINDRPKERGYFLNWGKYPWLSLLLGIFRHLTVQKDTFFFPMALTRMSEHFMHTSDSERELQPESLEAEVYL